MADMIDIPVLNRNFTNERIEMPYPHIKLLEPSDAVALVLPALATGDLPVICSVDGVTKQIGTIKNSALTISKLMKVSNIEYVAAKDSVRAIRDTHDAVDIFIK